MVFRKAAHLVLLFGVSFYFLSTSFCFAANRPKVETAKIVSYPNIKPFAYTHLWAVNDRTSGPTHGDDYQIARGRVGAKGYLTPKTDYMVLTEWGHLSYKYPVTLLDLWINYKVNPGFNIKLGQTWYKFTLSGTTTLPTIPFVYRPEIIDAIWLPMGRNGSYGYDKGIEVWGNFKDAKFPWSYAFFLTTGTGLSRFQDHGLDNLTARFTVEPLNGLMLGASGFSGYSRTEISSNLGSEEKKNLPEYAYGADISYNHKYFRVITEAVQSLYEGRVDVNGSEIFSIATKKQRGWYAMLGLKPLSWIEFPVQYAWYESNYAKSDTGLKTITVGLTWTLKKNTLNNIKVNYLIRSAQKNYGSNSRNKFIVQLQLFF